MTVLKFPDELERWVRNFKKNARGEFSDQLFALEDKLTSFGWRVDLFDHKLPSFHTYVDFEKKIIRHNNPKANLTFFVLSAIDEARASTRSRLLFTFSDDCEILINPYDVVPSGDHNIPSYILDVRN